MKTKTLKKNKVNIITLGCSKNLVDSENIFTQLKANNFDVKHESTTDDSNIVIINTCGFIDNAKEESINTILRYADAKAEGIIDKLYVTGCLSQRYKPELEADIPEVDAFFGTNELPRLLKTLKADYKHELVGERLITTPSHYAYLKISEGCDRPCSFCAIPIMRGKHVSTPVEQLVQQAKNLIKNGTKEIILIAQDLTYYGLDLYKKRTLADLLRRLSDIDGLHWLRLQYAYPSGFPLEVLDVMQERDNICKYLDMPLQHSSDRMLKIMRRGITNQKTVELIDTIRQKMPDLALRTTLITGHPGETDEDFEHLVNFVRQINFDRLGVFTYSHEEQTHAGNMVDDVPDSVKQERAEYLMSIQQEISYNKNQKRIGDTYKVLVDRVEGDYFIGRTQYDSPEVDNEVLIRKNENIYLPIGDFCRVNIVDAAEFDLFGTPI